MRAHGIRIGPALLLIVVGVLLPLNAALPSSAQAIPFGARVTHRTEQIAPLAGRVAQDPSDVTPVTTTVTPGPTTAPPELSMIGGFTSTATPCDVTDVTVTLTLMNTSSVATPADGILTVWLSHLNQNEAGGLSLTSVSSDFPATNLAVTTTGALYGFTLTLGALAPGETGHVTIGLHVTVRTTTGDLGILSAQVAEAGSGEHLSNNLTLPLQVTLNCPPPTPGPTQTPTSSPTATRTATGTSIPASTATAIPPTLTPTSSPTTAPSPTNTSQVASLVAPSSTAVPPSSTPIPPSSTPVPPSPTPVPPSATSTPSATATAPSAALAPPSATPRIVIKYKTVTRYRTVTRYHTVKRYQTIKRYRTITRYQTLIRYKTLFRTVVRYKTVVRIHTVQAVHVVVRHRVVVKRVTHTVLRTVIRHRTVTSIVYSVRVVGHPKTGRFAAPPVNVTMTGIPAPDAYISLPRLGISNARVWTRGYTSDGYGGFTYDIVPFYGVTRFAYSVPFGQPGTTMVYGHDDIYGEIFHHLDRMRTGDHIYVAVGHRRFDYVVRSASIVLPNNVSMLTVPRARATLALISCTPYWVDTHRVVVLAGLVH